MCTKLPQWFSCTGIVIWELFSHCELPYPALGNSEVLDEVRKGFRMPKPALCPHTVYTIMLRCWDKVPRSRPTAGDVASQLANILILVKQQGMYEIECPPSGDSPVIAATVKIDALTVNTYSNARMNPDAYVCTDQLSVTTPPRSHPAIPPPSTPPTQAHPQAAYVPHPSPSPPRILAHAQPLPQPTGALPQRKRSEGGEMAVPLMEPSDGPSDYSEASYGPGTSGERSTAHAFPTRGMTSQAGPVTSRGLGYFRRRSSGSAPPSRLLSPGTLSGHPVP